MTVPAKPSFVFFQRSLPATLPPPCLQALRLNSLTPRRPLPPGAAPCCLSHPPHPAAALGHPSTPLLCPPYPFSDHHLILAQRWPAAPVCALPPPRAVHLPVAPTPPCSIMNMSAAWRRVWSDVTSSQSVLARCCGGVLGGTGGCWSSCWAAVRSGACGGRRNASLLARSLRLVIAALQVAPGVRTSFSAAKAVLQGSLKSPHWLRGHWRAVQHCIRWRQPDRRLLECAGRPARTLQPPLLQHSR